MSYPAISLAIATVGRHRRPQKRLQTARQPPIYPNSSPDYRACNSLTRFQCPHAVHRWIRAYRGPNATEEEKRALEQRLRVVNQCALDTELYLAQDTAWRAEINRIFRETPDRIRPLKEEGIIDLLEEPGPAPFLVIQEFRSR